MSGIAGRWSIGGGDAAAGTDGSCQQRLHEDTRARVRMLATTLLESLVAARRSIAELEARGYWQSPFRW